MSSGLLFAGICAALGGMLVAAQGPIYARLSEGLNRDPLLAVFLAFLTATMATGLLVLGLGNWRSLSVSNLVSLPPWVWLGGLLGVCHVVISMLTIPVLGASLFLVLVVAGNLMGGAAYDHMGALGLDRRPLDVTRLFGLALVLAGVFVTTRA